jgi:hypothetical protein
MCIAAGALSIISTLAGLAGTAVSGIAQVNAQRAAEAQDKNNAIIAQRNAEDARNRGIVAEQNKQLETKQMIAKQVNVLSERSIDVGSGSALDIIGDTAMFGKLDALTTRGNFEREAIADETQKYNFLASAEQHKSAASASMFGTGISLFNTALGGVSDYRKTTGMSL